MNSLIRNKKKARMEAQRREHKMNRFYMFLGFALSRCRACGRMLYVAGRPHNHLYGKLISGEATKISCSD